jgi:hypothetical protein
VRTVVRRVVKIAASRWVAFAARSRDVAVE